VGRKSGGHLNLGLTRNVLGRGYTLYIYIDIISAAVFVAFHPGYTPPRKAALVATEETGRGVDWEG